ncbi:Nn.00g103640.m01.CDS01 [Neocucurbitaria sp. VM-36]
MLPSPQPFSDPYMGRCTSTGRKCDGYPPTKSDFQVQAWSASQDSSPQHAVPVLAEFGDTVRYLEFYHHCALPTLSSNFDRDFWSRIALQMAHSEPAVRHALIALGYLYHTEPGSMKHARSRFAAFNDRGTLLSHYNKSVRCLVDRLAESSCPPEITLVTCIFFVCIEFMRGNYHTGFTHLTNGLKIISQRRQRRLHDSPFSATGDGPEKAPDKFTDTTMIEEKLAPIFIRGIASALLYGVDAEKVFDMPWPTQTGLQHRPFASFLDAQKACHEIQNVSILTIRTMAMKLYQQEPISTEDLKHQRDLLDCHRSWYHNLELLERQQKLSKDEQIASSALRASYYSTFIYLTCAADVRQTPYDAFTEPFKKILHHSKIVIDSSTLPTLHAARFTFDISIIPPLYFVGCRCRSPAIRREAVALLARNPPREGLWDAEQHVVVTNRLIEMEEKEVDPETGWPVERTRFWSSVVDANMDRDGGFWVSFLLAQWLGVVGPEVLKTKLIWERFVL